LLWIGKQFFQFRTAKHLGGRPLFGTSCVPIGSRKHAHQHHPAGGKDGSGNDDLEQ
jgi:hypothetical protein